MSFGGIATLITMPVVGILGSKIDNRYLAGFGFALSGCAILYLTNMDLQMSFRYVSEIRFMQTLGIAFLFIPVSTLAYTGTTAAQSNDVSGMTNLARNVGGSCGTALVTTMLARRQQVHQTYLGGHAKNSNPFYVAKVQQLQQHYQQLGYGMYQAKQQALADFYHTLQNQASMLSYLDMPDAISGAVHLTLQDAIRRGLRANLAALSALLPSITGNLSENVSRVDLQSEGLSASTFGASSSGTGGSAISFPKAVGPIHYCDAHLAESEDLLDPTALHNLRSARASEQAASLSSKDARELVVYATAGTYLQLLAAMAEVDSERIQVEYALASYSRQPHRTARARSPPSIQIKS